LLKSKYTAARKLHTQDVAKSDPLPLEQPKGRIYDLAREIRNLEVLLHSFQQHARLELKNLELDQQLAAALLEAAKLKFYGNYGDYLAILNHELKSDKFLEGLQFRKDTIVSTQDLVKKIDEEAKDKENDKAASTPITDSLYQAHKFVKDQFDSAEDIIAVLRGYAERNARFHNNTKEWADNGSMHLLWQQIVKDRKEVELLNISEELRNLGKLTLEAVANKFFCELDWKGPADGGVYILSPLGVERAKKRIEANKKDKKEAPKKVKRDEEKLRREKEKELIERWFLWTRGKAMSWPLTGDQEIERQHRRRQFGRISDFTDSEELQVLAKELLDEQEFLAQTLQNTAKNKETVQEDATRKKAEAAAEIAKLKERLREKELGEVALLTSLFICVLVLALKKRA